MKEDEIDDISEKIDDASTGAEAHSTYVVPKDKSKHLSGMFQNWFLDYASYVILERAVPHIQDGLKPVQRRILHTMKELDDGRFNKVANIVGSTMQFTLTATPLSATPSCSSDRRNCLSTRKETGVTSSPVTAPQRHVTSRRVFQNSPSRQSTTPRPPTGP